MKSIFILCIFVFIAAGFAACNLDNVNPDPSPTTGIITKSDTSTKLISNTTLVGKWNIVADTIIDRSTDQSSIYAGIPTDHYTFTKYGNLYINSGFHSYVDTATYSLTQNGKVQWVNSYISVDGVSSRLPSGPGFFVISNLTAHSLVLTQDVFTGTTERYESVTFSK